ncbi:SH3 domain-containing protein [Pseudomonas sp. B707]|uniref:SH3 domain-containing protein n=1 Tax=Pseudomonas sp. B707 TaxID=2689570 RepID=UPI001F0D8A4F|nr:SH3 domain-containing protein [Pseudomonas sp. B707]MCH4898693.1 SH3 domain-containing protein [Pseudomonas sp. B707]
MKNEDASDEHSLEAEHKARSLFDTMKAEFPVINQEMKSSGAINAMLTIDKATESANSVTSMLSRIDRLANPLAATLARSSQLDRMLLPSERARTILASIEQYARPSECTRTMLANIEQYARPSDSTKALLANIEQYSRPSDSTRTMLANIEQYARPSDSTSALLAEIEQYSRPSDSTRALLANIEQYARPSDSTRAMLANIEQYARPSESTKAMLASIEQFARASESSKAILASIENLLEPHSFRKSVLRSVELLQRFPVFELLSSADPKVITSLVDVSSESDFGKLDSGRISQGVEAGAVADVELIRALQTAKEGTKLTLPALGLLILLLHSINSMYVMVAQWHDFRESVCDIQERLHGVASLSQARKAVRSLLCESPQELASNFRLVTGNGVALREKPSMKSNVIIDLLKYTPVEVLDSADRKWLYVRYSHGGVKFDGWIARTYVSPMSK